MDDELEKTDEQIKLLNVYTFTFGRNIYTIRLSDVKKITLLEHNFIENKDDKQEVQKTLYMFSVTGNQLEGIFAEDQNGDKKPMFETIMDVKADESDYASLYRIYEDLVIKWDAYQSTGNK